VRPAVGEGTNDGHQRHCASVGKQGSNLGDTAHIFATRRIVEAQVGIQTVTKVVGIQHIGECSCSGEAVGNRVGDR
jgi:hypothetical protein